MSQLEPLTLAPENDGMLPNNIAASQGVHSDFIMRPFSDRTFATVCDILSIIKRARLGQNFPQPFRRSTR